MSLFVWENKSAIMSHRNLLDIVYLPTFVQTTADVVSCWISERVYYGMKYNSYIYSCLDYTDPCEFLSLPILKSVHRNRTLGNVCSRDNGKFRINDPFLEYRRLE